MSEQQPHTNYVETPRPAPTKRVSLGLVIGISVAILLGVALGIGMAVLPRGGRITAGVSLLGEDLSGLTRAQAEERLTQALQTIATQQVSLAAGTHQVTVTLTELGITPDIDSAITSALDVAREGALPLAFPRRVLRAIQVRREGYTINAGFNTDKAKVTRHIAALGKIVNLLPVEATAHWDEKAQRLVITPDQPGMKINEAAALKMVEELVQGTVNVGLPLPETLQLPYQAKYATVTAAMLQPIDTVLGAYTTRYATSTANRASNVEVAARAIHGYIIKPGEEFSFNTVVGPRNEESGFRIAPVIVDGQLQPGIGGGICQVSTTLYNAALLANMPITQRSHHSLPIHYAPPGRDATVSYGAIDFRFKNPMDTPIYLEVHAVNRQLSIRLLGKGPAPVVRLQAGNISSIPGSTKTVKDPTLPTGTKKVNAGKAGIAVTITRVVGEGANAKSEVISRDKYRGEDTIIRMGTGRASSAVITQPISATITPAPTANR